MSFSTMKKIQSVTVSASTSAAMEFTSIPATFDDLLIKVSHRVSVNIGIAAVLLQYNSNASSYSYRRILGDGSTVASATDTTSAVAIAQGGNATASTFGNLEIYIPNYAGSTNKTASADNGNETNGTTEYLSFYAHLWSNTAAITSVKLLLSSGSFVTHSTATLYGIKRN